MTSPARREGAFTIIEMVIAMVLVAGLLIIVSTVLVRTFGESGRATQQRKAMQSVRNTMSQFGNDLRVARSPDRDPRYVGNGNDLGGALLSGRPLEVTMPGAPAPTVLDVRDVIEATSTSFAFRAEVKPNVPGAECVRYAVAGPGMPLTRTVQSYSSATRRCGAVLETQIMVQAVR